MSRVGLLFVYGVIWDLVWQLWLGVYRLEFHYGLSSGYGRDQVRTGEYIREGDFRSGGGSYRRGQRSYIVSGDEVRRLHDRSVARQRQQLMGLVARADP